MRSEANFRPRECHPRPRFGSRPARPTALFHQSRVSERPTHTEGLFGAGSSGAPPTPGFRRRACSSTSTTAVVTGVLCSYPVFSCSPRHRIVLSAKSISYHRSRRLAPIRCHCSLAITSATRNLQFTSPAIRSNVSHSAWVSMTRVGFFSDGALMPQRWVWTRNPVSATITDRCKSDCTCGVDWLAG